MDTRRARGDGSIRELKNGKFRVTVSLGVNLSTGKRERLTKVFDKQAAALAWKRERLREHEGGSLTATAMTLGDWLTTWLEIRKPEIAANTYRTEYDTAERVVRPGLGRVKLRELSPLVIARWLAQLDKAGSSQNERHKTGKLLRVLLNDAVRRKVIAVTPMVGLTIPQPPEAETTSLDQSQLDRLLTKSEELERGHLFTLWADAGLRPSELYALSWDDLDVKAKTIRVHKSLCQTTGKVKETKTKGSRRTLLLAPETVEILAAQPGSQKGVMFPDSTGVGNWWRTSFMKYVFDPVVEAAGLMDVMTPYTLRHTMATLLLQAGVSIKVVSERLGHSEITTTLKTYFHVMPGMQEAAASEMSKILSAHRRHTQQN